MYLAIVAALMFVLPLASVTYEVAGAGAAFSWLVVGKWFAFWSFGMRLFAAGLRQVIQPRYTARVILRLEGEESLVLVRELGFANLAMGLLGLSSLPFAGWRAAAALVGSVFYALAGVNHLLHSHRGKLENVAMVSDLWAAFVLSVSFVGMLSARPAS